MNFLYLIDPLETLHPKKDTSLALMAAATEKGHSVYWLTWRELSLVSGNLMFHAHEVKVKIAGEYAQAESGAARLLPAHEVDVFFIRTDPPFDLNYLTHMWLLEYLPSKTVILNEPAGLRTVNEKIFAARYRSIVPDTVITADKNLYREFLNRHGHIVAKPATGFGGSAVFLVRRGDSNAMVIFESLTRNGEFVILQEYLPAAAQGDKRILLLGGEILGAVLRLHADEDHRNNFAAGGSAQPTEITPRDKEIISLIKDDLLKLGLHFVGIDIIGSSLVEINVTSPTCLREINTLTGKRHEFNVIDYVEELCKKRAEKNK